jgi:hypothetical protein
MLIAAKPVELRTTRPPFRIMKSFFFFLQGYCQLSFKINFNQLKDFILTHKLLGYLVHTDVLYQVPTIVGDYTMFIAFHH